MLLRAIDYHSVYYFKEEISITVKMKTPMLAYCATQSRGRTKNTRKIAIDRGICIRTNCIMAGQFQFHRSRNKSARNFLG